MRAALLAGPAKQLLLLNFPNNPTGYMPTPAEVAAMRDAVLEAARAGKRLIVVCDDAYFGLLFDDGAIKESPFGFFANLHQNVLAIKLDGATKELFVWGLRCGFLSIAPPPGGERRRRARRARAQADGRDPRRASRTAPRSRRASCCPRCARRRSARSGARSSRS